jgi:hypothetical protein
MVVALLFVFCGIYFAVALQPVLGLPGNVKPSHTGTAEVLSCERSWVQLGMVDNCLAAVRWDDGWLESDVEPTLSNVTAARPISGSVRVEYFSVAKSRGSWTLPVDRPRFPSKGTYVFLSFVGVILLAGVGAFLGYLLARLLPEPPLPVKKFRRGVERRENPGFNGPRRRKRR